MQARSHSLLRKPRLTMVILLLLFLLLSVSSQLGVIANSEKEHTFDSLSHLSLAAEGTEKMGPIRIKASMEVLKTVPYNCYDEEGILTTDANNAFACKEKHVLSIQKKKLLKHLYMQAIKMHTDRLLVKYVDPTPDITGVSSCVEIQSKKTFSQLNDIDFQVHFITAFSGDKYMWSEICHREKENGRPLAGLVNIPVMLIMNSSHTTRLIAREIMHVLGFDALIFFAQGMLSFETARLKRYRPVLTSPMVVKAAKEIYGCDSIKFVELEDSYVLDKASSHWKARIAKDELMSSMPGALRYTALTIAAMEDTGFYKGNYSNAEVMPWGRGAGCDFLNKVCDDNSSKRYPGMFCQSNSVNYHCPTDRLGIGSCNDLKWKDKEWILDFIMNTDMAWREKLVDYCPIVDLISSEYLCYEGDSAKMPGSVHSISARCFATAGYNATVEGIIAKMGAICVDVQCDKATLTYTVKVKGARDYVDCPVGSTLELWKHSSVFNKGSILTCAPYEEVCD